MAAQVNCIQSNIVNNMELNILCFFVIHVAKHLESNWSYIDPRQYDKRELVKFGKNDGGGMMFMIMILLKH